MAKKEQRVFTQECKREAVQLAETCADVPCFGGIVIRGYQTLSRMMLDKGGQSQ